jgi:hypothetical protein
LLLSLLEHQSCCQKRDLSNIFSHGHVFFGGI